MISKKRGKEDVIIQYGPADNNIVLKGDTDRLSEVMWNLLDNATKFTEKGAISIVTMKDDNYITLTIKERGSGIDSDVLPKLFTKFGTKSEKGTVLDCLYQRAL